MAQDYEVVSAVKTGSYSTQYGEMYKYAVELKGESDGVELSQKPETPAPAPGSTLHGSITSDKYGRKFKKEQKGGGGYGGGSGGAAPANTPSIEKQKSLAEAAVTINVYFQNLVVIDPIRADKEFPKNIKEFVTLQNSVTRLHLGLLQKSVEEITGQKPAPKTDIQKVQDVIPGAQEVDNMDVSAELDKLDL